jgi:hypothetical protein
MPGYAPKIFGFHFKNIAETSNNNKSAHVKELPTENPLDPPKVFMIFSTFSSNAGASSFKNFFAIASF